MKRTLVLASMCLASSAFAEKWNSANHPGNFNPIAKNKISYSFASLPLEAKLKDDRFGWSETYWPSNMGGIAYRWNHPNPQPFTYKLYTKEELQKMSEAELSQLSPAELYDISQGDYSYPLTKKVLKTYNPKDLWWEGICHGWSQAAANYAEPMKVVVTNKDGIHVPFGSSDVKGLLSMHDAFNSKGRYVRVGERCAVKGKVEGEEEPEDGIVPKISPRDAQRDECRDVNAGAFHLILTNMIGVNSQSFVADVDRFNDVWNQPITSYTSQVLGEVALDENDKKAGVSKKVRIHTKMTYGEELIFYDAKKEAEGEIGFVSKEPVTGTPVQMFTTREYEYALELDVNGNVIGGEWITESRPDMLWAKSRDVTFLNGKFPLAGLKSIYKPVER